MKTGKRILLHGCCGVCAGYPIEYLKRNGYDITVYFYNPNINTKSEFDKRAEGISIVCEKMDCELIIEPYEHNEFLQYIRGLESEREGGARCIKCIELRLKKSYAKSQDLGIGIFTTTLTVSPHKNFERISEIGKSISESFEPINFKKSDGFIKTNRIAKGLNLYRQDYCGCNLGEKRG